MGGAGDLALDFFSGRADGVDRLHTLLEQRTQQGVVGVFVLAAEDEMDAAGKRSERLHGGVHIGRFRIVVVGDAGNVSNKLETMLDRVEDLDCLGDGFLRNTGELCRADGGQHILDIVVALQRNAAHRHNWFETGLLIGAEGDVAIEQRCALANDLAAAEPVDLRLRTARRLLHARVVSIEYQVVFTRLRGEDALLCERIVFEGAVAIEMVGRDVQDDGDLWTEELDCLQLEAGNLEDRPGVFRVARFVDQLDDGQADVAADLRR